MKSFLCVFALFAMFDVIQAKTKIQIILYSEGGWFLTFPGGKVYKGTRSAIGYLSEGEYRVEISGNTKFELVFDSKNRAYSGKGPTSQPIQFSIDQNGEVRIGSSPNPTQRPTKPKPTQRPTPKPIQRPKPTPGPSGTGSIVTIIFKDTSNAKWILKSDDGTTLYKGSKNVHGPLPFGTYTLKVRKSGFDLRVNSVNIYTTTRRFVTVTFTTYQDGSSTVISPNSPNPSPSPRPNPSPSPRPNPSPSPRPGGFEIELVPADGYDPSSHPKELKVLRRAANRWSQVITGDLPDILGVDDIRIYYDFSYMDGPGDLLGYATVLRARSGTLLPFEGEMVFDSADLEERSEEALYYLMIHEMGHCLGIGTMWNRDKCSKCEQGDPLYKCEKAVSKFKETPGYSSSMQLEIEMDGESGTKCGHFDEEQLQNEVMTGYSSSSDKLSTITIGALEDLGYEVDYNAADQFSIAKFSYEKNNTDAINVEGDVLLRPVEIDFPDDERENEFISFEESKKSAISTGEAIGISIGVIAFIAILVQGIMYYKKTYRKNHSPLSGEILNS